MRTRTAQRHCDAHASAAAFRRRHGLTQRANGSATIVCALVVATLLDVAPANGAAPAAARPAPTETRRHTHRRSTRPDRVRPHHALPGSRASSSRRPRGPRREGSSTDDHPDERSGTGGQSRYWCSAPASADGTTWLRVLLPQRPNGLSGWIDSNFVELMRTPWRIDVSLRARTVSLLRDGRVAGSLARRGRQAQHADPARAVRHLRASPPAQPRTTSSEPGPCSSPRSRPCCTTSTAAPARSRSTAAAERACSTRSAAHDRTAASGSTTAPSTYSRPTPPKAHQSRSASPASYPPPAEARVLPRQMTLHPDLRQDQAPRAPPPMLTCAEGEPSAVRARPVQPQARHLGP